MTLHLHAFRSRVLILAPTGRDAALASAALQRAGFNTHACGTLTELVTILKDGGGAALITEEALVGRDILGLLGWIEGQPSWSDFPFIILLERGASPEPGGRERDFLQRAGNFTLLERPIGAAALVSTVSAALRARRRQYEVHDALRALEESENRYRTLAEALPQLVWTSRPDGSCDYLSNQWVSYTGVPAEEQVGFAWLVDVTHPDDRQQALESWSRATQRDSEFDTDLRIRSAAGDYRWFKLRATAIRGEEGSVSKWFGTATDISDIVEARDALKRTGEELEMLVAERTRGLEKANARLTAEIAERERTQAALQQSQKLEAIGQLTSGVAHDFNNLLAAVIGNLGLAQERVDDSTTSRFLRSALGAADRGARLTQQLLAFSRKQHLAPKTLDLNKLVGEASDMLFRTLGTKVRIETVLTGGLWPALADPTQLDLVLLNLAINARDAMPDGGLITIRTSNVLREAAPADLQPADYVVISVTDTGTGMSEEVLSKAVDPFFTTKQVGSGSGLGLSMVQGVASQSGGGLRIESRVGHGTTVSVYLPRAFESVSEAALPEHRGEVEQTRARILVVDDDPAVRELTVYCLQRLGHEVLHAADGPTALKVLTSHSVDLVVADLAMPGMNGVDLIRQARRQRPGLRALLITGFANMAAFGEPIDDPVLQKPFRIEALAEGVARALAFQPRDAGLNVVSIRPGARS